MYNTHRYSRTHELFCCINLQNLYLSFFFFLFFFYWCIWLIFVKNLNIYILIVTLPGEVWLFELVLSFWQACLAGLAFVFACLCSAFNSVQKTTAVSAWCCPWERRLMDKRQVQNVNAIIPSVRARGRRDSVAMTMTSMLVSSNQRSK